VTLPDAKRAVLKNNAVPSVFQWSGAPRTRKPPARRQLPAAAGAPSTSTSESVSVVDTGMEYEPAATLCLIMTMQLDRSHSKIA